jgi:hypothetical protein
MNKTQDLKDICIEEIKYVWVVFSNTDLTEGRGHRYPLYICESPETAARLGRRKYVQGSDCPFEKFPAYKIGGYWYYLNSFQAENKEDIDLRIKRERKEETLNKAKAAGLSDEDLKYFLENECD